VKTHISLLDAVGKAQATGAVAELLSGVEIQPHSLLVSLTTADSEPMLVVRRHGLLPEPVDALLEAREQSGADRWDYPYSVHCWRDRLVLRLRRGAVVRDVEVLQSAAAILHTLGSSDEPSVLVPALVNTREFDAAITALNAGDATSSRV